MNSKLLKFTTPFYYVKEMDGFDCDFTKDPPECLQSHCPICLLILREPFQVTCCGNSFCRTCIQRIGQENQSCPTCKKENFQSFQNKGLQRPLNGFQVFCSNKESGCDWQGELGTLDKHLNLNHNLSVSCAFVNVQCAFCNASYQRSKIECHQDSQCAQRPFTCSMCQEFESTYDDVITNHAPVCKWRPVECPNSCGAKNLQHQHLEEHVSTQCPLSYVDCEFSDAGCDVKVHRKDLPSHLGENMVTHVSLLARENRKLKLQLKQQELQLTQQEQQIKQQEQQHKQQEQQHSKEKEAMKKTIFTHTRALQTQEKLIFASFRPQVPPIRLDCAGSELLGCTGWVSEPFYSHIGGYKLQLFTCQVYDKLCCMYLESEFPAVLPSTQQITLHVIDQEDNENAHKIVKEYKVIQYNSLITILRGKTIKEKYVKNNKLVICVNEVKTL